MPHPVLLVMPERFSPTVHRRCAQFAMMAGADVVARDVEQVGKRVMDRDETLYISL